MPSAAPRIIRRVIRVGIRVVTGVVCPRCIVPTVIFPESDLEPHLDRHGPAPAPAVRNCQGGRPAGSRNVHSMSATGVEKKTGIRSAR